MLVVSRATSRGERNAGLTTPYGTGVGCGGRDASLVVSATCAILPQRYLWLNRVSSA